MFNFDPSQWCYLNEGAANIIFACQQSDSQYANLVLRVNKFELTRVINQQQIKDMDALSRTDGRCDRKFREIVQSLIGSFAQSLVSVTYHISQSRLLH